MQTIHHQHIIDLFYSGQAANVELAIQLAKQEKLNLKEHILPIAYLHQQSQLSEDSPALNNKNLTDLICEVLNAKDLYIMFSHDISPALWKLTKLENLTFEHFTWSSLPAQIAQLQQLRTLRLNCGYSLRKLCPEIGQLANLEELHLDMNALEDLPPEIGDLSNLKLLSVRSNCLHSLPEELSKLPQIQKFYLAQNDLRRELIPTILTNKTKTNRTIVNALRRVFKW